MTAPDASELPAAERDRLAEIIRRHGVRLLLVHGSLVKGGVHARSDVDLGVQLVNPDDANLFRLISDLQALFPDRQVDLVTLNRADPLLAWQVCRDARLLAGDPAEFASLRRYAWRRYVEYRPFLERESRAVADRLAELRDAG